MFAFCLGLVPLLFASQTAAGKGNRPAGQFSADVRTLVAAMRYLIESDAGGRSPDALAKETLPASAFQAMGQPADSVSSSSDQMRLPKCLTNRPARG